MKRPPLPGRAWVIACIAGAALVVTAGTCAAAARETAEPGMPAASWRGVLLVESPPGYRQPTAPLAFGDTERDRCLGCHGMPGFVSRDSASGEFRRLTVDAAAFRRSAHGALACTQCHPDVRGFPHAFGGARRPRVGCDADCHARDAKGRPVRHSQQVAEFRRGAHRKGLDGDPDSPGCAYCHGQGDPHAAVRVKEITREGRVELCGSCHEDRERMARRKLDADAPSSYRAGFHHAALRLGEPRAAACQDCHGTHAVLASRDTASTTSAIHLQATCGRKGCHPGAGARFAASGTDHAAMRSHQGGPANRVGAWFAWLGGTVLLVMALGVAFDLQRPLRGRAGAGALVPRLSAAMRLQHGVLVASFTALALTGLPLAHPDVEALRTLNAAFGGWQGARAVHRVAGALLLLLAAVHAAYAAVRLVRARFDVARAWPMLPAAADAREAWETLRYQLRLRPEPPALGRHEFRARVHYLAVLWGVPVMALTGLALWLAVPLAEHLPGSVLAIAAVVHGEEAVVAVAIVLLWHFYNVHFAPGRGLRAWTFLDGRVTQRHQAAVHARDDGSAIRP